MIEVEILKAVPAAGKTKAILEHVQKNNRPTLIASISCQLSQQSFDYYVSNGGEGAVIIDNEHVSSGNSVAQTLEKCLDTFRVIFITHSALLQFKDFGLMQGFDLYIDEVPELIDLHQMNFTDNLDILRKYCNVTEDGSMTLMNTHRTRVKRIAKDGLHKRDVVAESVFKLSKALLTGTPVLLREKSVYFVEDNSIHNWEAFNKITISCANFEETLTGVILKEYNGWKFVTSPLTKKLDFVHYPNSERVEIITLYKGAWSRHASEKSVGDTTLYNKMKGVVDDVTGAMPYIYTTNSYRAAFKSGQKISYNPHGLNQYMAHTQAVAMFSYNPQPWQIRLLRDLVKDKENPDLLVQAFSVSKYLEPVFQLCLRTDVRNQHSTHKVRLFVPDMRAAVYLKTRYLNQSNINQSYAIDEIVDRKERAKETKPRAKRLAFTNMFNMSKEEKMKFKYWKRTNTGLNVMNQSHVLLVKQWVESIR